VAGADSSLVAAGAPGAVSVSSPDGTRIWQLTRSGVIRVSTDAGKSWGVELTQPDARFRAASALSADVCWAVGEAGLVMRRTADRGWTRVAAPVADDLVAVSAKDAMIASVATVAGVTYETRDGGRNWSRK
jgi:photosystem II stability/assembly factor-like uncharacterized protein